MKSRTKITVVAWYSSTSKKVKNQLSYLFYFEFFSSLHRTLNYKKNLLILAFCDSTKQCDFPWKFVLFWRIWHTVEWHSCYFVEMLCFKNILHRKKRERKNPRPEFIQFLVSNKVSKEFRKNKTKRKEIIIISIEEFMMPSFFPLSNNIKIHIL